MKAVQRASGIESLSISHSATVVFSFFFPSFYSFLLFLYRLFLLLLLLLRLLLIIHLVVVLVSCVGVVGFGNSDDLISSDVGTNGVIDLTAFQQ